MKLFNSLSLFVIVIFSLAACDASHSGTASGVAGAAAAGPPSQDEINAFQSTVYAFGYTQGCVNCHASIVIPEWMNSDPGTAYGFAAPLVDFTNPTASVYATYVANNHCGNPTICGNAANVPVMENLLTQWAETETIVAGGGSPSATGSTLATPKYVTASMNIPASLPTLTAASPAVMRFDLSQLTPAVPALSGSFLELSIRTYNSAGNEYKVYNPRIIGNPQVVSFVSIHVYVRPATGTGLGTEDVTQGDLWSGVNATAAVNAAPSPLPAGAITQVAPLTTISLGIEAQSTADVMTIGFAQIQ